MQGYFVAALLCSLSLQTALAPTYNFKDGLAPYWNIWGEVIPACKTSRDIVIKPNQSAFEGAAFHWLDDRNLRNM